MKSSFKSETIQVDGDTYIIKEMDAGSADEYQSSLYTVNGQGQIKYNTKDTKVKLVFYCLHDEQGQRVFTKEADLELIKKLPSSLIEEIFDKASELNNLSPDEKDKTEKN